MTYHKQVIIIDNEASCRNKLQIGKNINLGGIKMKAKTILSLLLVIALSGSLTACGSASPAASSTAKTPDKTTNAEKIKLVAPYLGYNDDQIAAAKAQEKGLSVTDRYYMGVRKTVEDTYPNYEVEWADWGWAETLDQKQRLLISAGDVPNIVAGETFMPTYANEGLLESLPQDIVDAVNPSFLIYDQNGKAVSVAYKSSVQMLFYNKDLLKAAGLDPEKPPKTWDEFRAMSTAVTKAGAGKFYGGGIPSFPHFGGTLRATPFFRLLGTDFAKDGQSNLMDSKVKDALQFVRDMNTNFPAGLGNAADEGPLWNAFQKDKTIAFVINGVWEASDATINGVNWGVSLIPMPEGGVDGNCMIGSVYTSVPKASKNKDAAFNLIRAALKEENEKIWLENSICVPLKSIIENTSLYQDNPTLMVANGALKDGKYSGLATFAKNDSQVWEIINTKVLARTTMTKDDISKICSDAEKEIEPLTK